MSDAIPRALTLAAALGAALVAGIFYAFSTFVMKALARLPPAQAIAAMQSINVAVINPLFMAAFLGTAVAWSAASVVALAFARGSGGDSLLAGGLLYLFGTILVTLACNVPLNNALAAVDPGSAEGARLWSRYLERWTMWNHVRTAAAFVAAVLLMLAFGSRGQV